MLSWVQAQLAGKSQEEFPTLGDVFATSQQQDVKDGPGDSRWEPITPRTFLFKKFFKLLKPTDRHYQIVEVMQRCGFTLPVLETLPEAILVPLQDAIAQSQTNPPASWPSKLLGLVNRSDINMILKPNKPSGAASLGSAVSNSLVVIFVFSPQGLTNDIESLTQRQLGLPNDMRDYR